MYSGVLYSIITILSVQERNETVMSEITYAYDPITNTKVKLDENGEYPKIGYVSKGVYQINSAGLFYVGHFNKAMYKITFGNPDTRLYYTFSLNSDIFNVLSNLLNLDVEDGVYMDKLLLGKNIMLYFDDKDFLVGFGDIFENRIIDIENYPRVL